MTGRSDDPLVVVVSIDTEEDNWQPSRDGVTLQNIQRLPTLDHFLQQLAVRPTYFVAHSVLCDPTSRDVLRSLDGATKEFATHLHPWNTPPQREEFLPHNTMLHNLPGELQAEKIAILTETFTDVFHRPPTSFRAGRFGFGAETVAPLVANGYQVDSSVTPYVDWGHYDRGPSFVNAPLAVYRLKAGEPVDRPRPDGDLIELPVSCGFNRLPFDLVHRRYQRLTSPLGRHFRLSGLAYKSGWLRRIILCPELHSARDMLALCRSLANGGYRYVQLYWHSCTLHEGLTPYTPQRADVTAFYDRLGAFFEGLSDLRPLQFMTVTEAALHLV